VTIDIVREHLRRADWWLKGLSEELKMAGRQAQGRRTILPLDHLERLTAALSSVNEVLAEEHQRLVAVVNRSLEYLPCITTPNKKDF
jgi:hypothetical protein